MLEEYRQLKKEFRQKANELKNKIRAEASQLLTELLKPVFEKYPQVEGVSFTSYTCYFADGDPVYHSTSLDYPYLTINGEKLSEDDFTYKTDEHNNFSAMATEFSAILRELDDKEYLEMFGDHKEITITREGIKLNNYTNHN